MVRIDKEIPQAATGNSLSGGARNVVQTGSADTIIIGASHDKRGVIALSVIAVVLVVASVVVVRIVASSRSGTDQSHRGQSSTGVGDGRSGEPPIAAVTSYGPVDCQSGWVVADGGDEPIPFDSVTAAGGVLTSGGQVIVTVQGATGRAIVLQSISVEVVRRSPALAGVYLMKGCQGEVSPRKSVLDLDRKAPKVVPEPAAGSFPYKVSDVEPEQFVITPTVTAEDIEWRMRLHWTSGGNEGELVLDDDGEPFRTTAIAAARAFCLDYASSAWRPSC